MATAKQNGLSILSNGGDDFRPRILQRPKPSVTILKRPDSSPALSSTQQNSKPQLKTLEQREKEYAEARLRILGSAASDESPTEQRWVNFRRHFAATIATIALCFFLASHSSLLKYRHHHHPTTYLTTINLNRWKVPKTLFGYLRDPFPARKDSVYSGLINSGASLILILWNIM